MATIIALYRHNKYQKSEQTFVIGKYLCIRVNVYVKVCSRQNVSVNVGQLWESVVLYVELSLPQLHQDNIIHFLVHLHHYCK